MSEKVLHSAKVGKQLSVFVEDEPGTLTYLETEFFGGLTSASYRFGAAANALPPVLAGAGARTP